MLRCLTGFLVTFALTRGNAGIADEYDFSNQLPRVAPRSPEDSERSFHTLDGFRVQLVASEPLVVDPVAIAFDADARMYVVEMRGYSEDGEARLGRIRQLRDTDGDGRYDISTIFAKGLSWPTAVTCYDDGILVAAAPDLIFMRDTDRDGISDEQHVWFQGFGRHNVQGLVNSLTWGLDQHIHGATSSTGASLRNCLDPKRPVIELRGRDFALDPRRLRILPTSGGGQHGLTFSRWGEKFVCSNSDHIQQIVLDDRYLTRNPWMQPPSVRVSIAADGPQAAVFRRSPVESWRKIRTQLRVSGAVPGPIEGGGTASGYFTGATGLTLYRGDAWPKEYLDMALVCDVGSNLIHRKRLVDEGTRYRAERIDAKSEFVATDDIWFRPVQLANAPDGSIYVVDMYREVIEHPASLPPMIKRHLDLTSGRDRGRIYRIIPSRFSQPSLPQLSELTTPELVRLLAHANVWHRDTASRLLCERDDASAFAPIRQLFHVCPDAAGRLQCLYVLFALEGLTVGDVMRGLDDVSPRVRRHAVRLSESWIRTDATLGTTLVRLADEEENARVRMQLALSLGELPDSKERRLALARLAQRSVAESDTLAAIQTSLLDGADRALDSLARQQDFRQAASGRRFLRQLASQLRRQQDPSHLGTARNLISHMADHDTSLTSELLVEWLAHGESAWSSRLREEPIASIVDQVVDDAIRIAQNSSHDVNQRRRAIQHLAMARWERVAELYTGLMDADQPLSIQLSTIQSVRRRTSRDVATQLLAHWDQYSPTLRTTVVDLLMTRLVWQSEVIHALENGRVDVRELSAAQQQQLMRTTGAQALESILQGARPATTRELEALFALYREALSGPGDLSAGRQVFAKACASCHRLDGVGHEIGPNLAAMKSRGPDSILVNVLDPNREVNPQYFAYSAVTIDGRILAGMIRNETSTSLELIQANGTSETLLREEIDTVTSTRQSLMPTGLQTQISPTAMNDLITYLQSVGGP